MSRRSPARELGRGLSTPEMDEGLRGAPADREGEGGMRRGPAGVSAICYSRHQRRSGITVADLC